jgi:hypothetical protein
MHKSFRTHTATGNVYRRYYVYEYLREDGTPYYIGKGKGSRAFRKHDDILVPRYNDRINIIIDDLSEDEAYEIEKGLIKHYGRLDNNTGILENYTDGGKGSANKRNIKEPEPIVRLRKSFYKKLDYKYGK